MAPDWTASVPNLEPFGPHVSWPRALVGFHMLADLTTATAYIVIAISCLFVLRKRPDKALYKPMLAAATLLFLCALTHLFDVSAFWFAAYIGQAIAKGICAIASIGTAAYLCFRLPAFVSDYSRDGVTEDNRLLRNDQQHLTEDIVRVRDELDALHLSSSRNSELFDSSSDAILIRETDDTITYWNQGAVALYGFTARQAIGLTPQKLLKTRFPRGETSESIRRHRNWQGELRHTSRDGHPLVVMSRWVTQVSDDAKPLMTLEINTDITAQSQFLEAKKQQEIRFRCLFNSAMIGILIASEEGVLHEVNDTFLRWLGYTQDDLPTLDLKSFTPAPWRHVDDKMKRDLQEFGRSTHNEKECVRKDGSFLPVTVDCAYLEGSSFVLYTVGDVHTQRRVAENLEETVRDRTAQLSASNKELEAFCYSVSHDLRAPLRAIHGFSDILVQRFSESLGKQGQDYLRRVCNAATRMSSLIDDLLALSRLTRRSMQVERVDMTALADTVVDTLAAMEPARTVEVTVQRGMVAQGDAVLVYSVMQNLIGNAWKFSSKEETGKIAVSTEREPDGTAVFSVEDNGVGFDMDHAQKLFSAFQRLHLRSEFEGTGVGLASVQRIVHRHGGRVWAKSNPGGGATFSFTLTPKGGGIA